MGDYTEVLTTFFEHVSEKKIPESKAIIGMSTVWGEGRLGQGRRAALEGIITLLNVKSTSLENLSGKIDRVVGTYTRRKDTIWSDDFDRGYFELWMRFSEFIRERRLK